MCASGGTCDLSEDLRASCESESVGGMIGWKRIAAVRVRSKLHGVHRIDLALIGFGSIAFHPNFDSSIGHGIGQSRAHPDKGNLQCEVSPEFPLLESLSFGRQKARRNDEDRGRKPCLLMQVSQHWGDGIEKLGVKIRVQGLKEPKVEAVVKKGTHVHAEDEAN